MRQTSGASKQYVNGKPIQCGFKMWCRCDSKSRYLFEFDLYTGKKQGGEECGLGQSANPHDLKFFLLLTKYNEEKQMFQGSYEKIAISCLIAI